MTTKTATAPRLEDGDFTDEVECTAHGFVVHQFFGKLGGWGCTSCGRISYPTEPVVPHRLKAPVYAEPRQAPMMPQALRQRMMDGTSSTVPLTDPRGYEVIVRPYGDPDSYAAVLRCGLFELADLKPIYEGKSKP